MTPIQAGAVEKIVVIDAGLASQEGNTHGAFQFARLAAVSGHVSVLPIVTISLTCTVGGRGVLWLSEVREETADIAAMCWIVGIGNDWDSWTFGHTLPRYIVSVKIIRTINDTHCRGDITVKRRIRRTLPHTSPN